MYKLAAHSLYARDVFYDKYPKSIGNIYGSCDFIDREESIRLLRYLNTRGIKLYIKNKARRKSIIVTKRYNMDFGLDFIYDRINVVNSVYIAFTDTSIKRKRLFAKIKIK